ncbi:MAG: hypothetical protein JWM80_5182 [Cyanobacteria bacterium RYN_339]|nr:hypothetical protein [Cyanobacteria bacterium RYN_339]
MRYPLVLLAVLAVTACQPLMGTLPAQVAASSPAPVGGSTLATPVTTASAPAALAIVKGTVKAPAGIVGAVISNNGGNVIPTGGGNVIPTGGGNVIPTGGGNFQLQGVAESPLANTEVFLADAAGQPFPSLAAVKTDANGQFTFPQVPAGHTYMVVARGRDTGRNKDVTLQTLVAPSELGATTAIDTSTSLVTLAVTQDQGNQALGQFNAAAFRTATEATAKGLGDKDVPDLSDRGAVLAKVTELSKSIAELKTALEAIRQDLKDIKQSIDELKTQVAKQQQAPPPQPQPQGPPNGQGQGPGGCQPPIPFDAVLVGTYPADGYPMALEFRPSPDGPVLFKGTFQAPGQSARTAVPPNCAHWITVRDKNGKVVATSPAWAPPVGSTNQRVNLPV